MSHRSRGHCRRWSLRETEVADELVDALWTRCTMRETYGSGPRVAALTKAIERVRYEGLDRSHLEVAGV